MRWAAWAATCLVTSSLVTVTAFLRPPPAAPVATLAGRRHRPAPPRVLLVRLRMADGDTDADPAAPDEPDPVEPPAPAPAPASEAEPVAQEVEVTEATDVDVAVDSSIDSEEEWELLEEMTIDEEQATLRSLEKMQDLQQQRQEVVSNNPYLKGTPTGPSNSLVQRLSQSSMIGKFADNAPERVQRAMKTTVLGLLGNMEMFAIDATTVATAENLANLMFQLQMTGYMFKNAETALSVSEQLSMSQIKPNEADGGPSEQKVEEEIVESVQDKSEVTGTLKVSMEDGTNYEVDADLYVSSLRGELDKLRGDLALVSKREAEATSKDLIAYINSLPREEMASLTSGVSSKVLEAMETLVKSMVREMAGDQREDLTDMKPVTMESQDVLSNLCMWQLITGYNLRTHEIKVELDEQWTALMGTSAPPRRNEEEEPDMDTEAESETVEDEEDEFEPPTPPVDADDKR